MIHTRLFLFLINHKVITENIEVLKIISIGHVADGILGAIMILRRKSNFVLSLCIGHVPVGERSQSFSSGSVGVTFCNAIVQ